jgi:hypothetical protein
MYKTLNILRIILGGGFLYMWFGSNVRLRGGYIIAIAFWIVFLLSSVSEIVLWIRKK